MSEEKKEKVLVFLDAFRDVLVGYDGRQHLGAMNIKFRMVDEAPEGFVKKTLEYYESL